MPFSAPPPCRRLRAQCWDPSLWSTIQLVGEAGLDTDASIRAILGRLVWASRGARGGEGRGAGGVTTVLLGGCTRLTDRTLALLGKNCPALQHLQLAR